MGGRCMITAAPTSSSITGRSAPGPWSTACAVAAMTAAGSGAVVAMVVDSGRALSIREGSESGRAPSSTNSTTAAATAVATGCWIAVLVSRSAATSCDAEHLSTRSSSSAGTRGHCAVCQAEKRAFCADFLWSDGLKKGGIESVYLQSCLLQSYIQLRDTE